MNETAEILSVPVGKPIIALLVAILVEGLNLNQRIPQAVIYNQQWKMPRDQGLHLHIGVMIPKPFSIARDYQEGPDGQLQETLSGNKVEAYELNLYSKDGSAIESRDLIGMALRSTFSEQVQEANGFQIGRIPITYVDASEIDGEGILTRYVYTFNVTSSFSRTGDVPYFDKLGRPGLFTQP